MQNRRLHFEWLEAKQLLHGNCSDTDVHATDPVRKAEHVELFCLVQPEDANAVAIESGDWSDTQIWRDGLIPNLYSRVLIPESISVQLDTETPPLFNLRVDGTLSFDTQIDTHLRAETIIVSPSGRLEIGVERDPIAATATVTFWDNGPIDTDYDPLLLSRGLISHGSVEIFGAEKTSHQDAIGPLAGATSIELVDPVVGWKPGDRVLIPGLVRPNEDYRGITTQDEDEIITIASIDDTTLMLSQPLRYDHVPPEPGLRFPIANLDRNIVFASQSHGDQREGHVMFMHSRDVSVNYASFQNGGRNDKSKPTTDPEFELNGDLIPGTGDNIRARYAVHFHRTGVAREPSDVVGSVVEGSKGWGFVNHDSSVVFADNVSYNVKGAGFVTEVGNETGRFENNLAVRSSGVPWQSTFGGSDKDERDGLGSAGHGFWMQSPRVELIDNVASGHAQEGIFLHGFAGGREVSVPLAESPDTVFDQTDLLDGPALQVRKVPFNTIEGNTVFASGTGLATRWHRQPDAPADGSRGNLISGTTIYNVQWTGMRLDYTAGIVLRDTVILGQDIPLSQTELQDPELRVHTPQGKGILGNRNSRDLRFYNTRVEGFAVGIQTLTNSDTVIEGASLRNEVNIRVPTPQATLQDGDGERRVFIKEVTNLPGTGVRVALPKQLRAKPVAAGRLDDWLAVDRIYYESKRLFYHDQAADAVPFPSHAASDGMKEDAVFSQYLDLTQQTLWDRYGVALGGQVAPSNTFVGGSSMFALVQPWLPVPAPHEPVQIDLDDSLRGSVLQIGQQRSIQFTTRGVDADSGFRMQLIDEDSTDSTRIGLSFDRFNKPEVVAANSDGSLTWGFEWSTARNVLPGTFTLLATLDRFSAFESHVTLVLPTPEQDASDLNGDGRIDSADAAIMFSYWGSSDEGDINKDGVVDAAEASILFTNWTGQSDS